MRISGTPYLFLSNEGSSMGEALRVNSLAQAQVNVSAFQTFPTWQVRKT